MDFKQIIFIFLSIIFLSCEEQSGQSINREIGFNDDMTQAQQVFESQIYHGSINTSSDKIDQDFYKFDAFSGEVVYFEFQTKKSDFVPYLFFQQKYGSLKFVVFQSGTKKIVKVFVQNDGAVWFSVGDYRNFNKKEPPFFGGKSFQYWFKFKTGDICLSKLQDLSVSKELKDNLFDDKGSFKAYNFPEIRGIYAVSLKSDRKNDKKMMIYDCKAHYLCCGSDDIDKLSGNTDSRIYRNFTGKKNLKLIVDDWTTNFRDDTKTNEFTLKIEKQKKSEELEPNNTFEYANFLQTDEMSGNLAKKPFVIDGELQGDKDFFRVDIDKDTVVDFDITTFFKRNLLVESFAYAYNVTGMTIIPLKINSIDTETDEQYAVNLYMPFRGTLYFMLQGINLPYKFKFKKYKLKENVFSGENIFQLERCKTKFVKFQYPFDVDKLKISVSDVNKKTDAGIYVYADEKPYILLDPVEKNTFYLLKNSISKNMVFGVFLNECEQNEDARVNLKIKKVDFNLIDLKIKSSDAKTVEAGNSYLGYFSSKLKLVKNRFEIVPKKDGILLVTTNPLTSEEYLDTVLFLYDENNELLTKNDDMLNVLNSNRFSFLRFNVKKGKKYIIEATPFMDESSDIEAMNMEINYILDINIE